MLLVNDNINNVNDTNDTDNADDAKADDNRSRKKKRFRLDTSLDRVE
jgi:hypothetical protein